MALVVMLAFQPVFFFNFFRSLVRGPNAGANPWSANTLEWTAPSPPPHGNFAELPKVYRGPYEYSDRGSGGRLLAAECARRFAAPAPAASVGGWR